MDWQSVVTLGSLPLAAKYHIEPHDVVRSSVAHIKDSFWFYFSELLQSVLSVFFVSFCIIVCALSCILLFMLHSCVLN